LNVADFIAKWHHVELTERASAQSHFIDLCTLVGHPSPVEADPKGEWFTFERGVTKRTGKRGWADVWKRDFFAFEYKGRHKDLNAAYDQLLTYKTALDNPPLLVTCDIERLVVHTNFPGTVEQIHEVRLDELARPAKLDLIQWVFHDKEKLRPAVTREAITNKVAGQLGKIAQGFRDRGLHPRAVAKFLNRLVFCMFAEDVGLLPPNLFTRIVDASHHDPKKLAEFLKNLFAAMAGGGTFGVEPIKHFNGNLFEDAAVILPTADEMGRILEAARLDWSQVDPSIFGTLFERGMDPGKRSQLGAHYTSREDIETLIEPVVMDPLRREWAEVRQAVEQSMEIAPKGETATPARKKGAKKTKGSKIPDALIRDYLQRLQSVTVLDPACGSGNFLYVALQKLKDLEQEVLVYYEDRGFGKLLPFVGPRQLLGLEVNAYAFDLAQMTVWIGYLQWQRLNGYRTFTEPILQRLDTFRCMDSILDLSDPSHPKEPEWPTAEFIVGNPPFLGNKRMRNELGDVYCESLWKLFGGRIPATSDLCCYWYEKASSMISLSHCTRAGLIATQGIRGGGSREVLNRIKSTGDIFFGISDQDWLIDGANVHVSLIGFDNGSEQIRTLNKARCESINSDLTLNTDVTKARTLTANLNLVFMGTTKVGSFDVDQFQSLDLLHAPTPHGRPNSDVLRPFRNGSDLVRKCSNRWIIDFGVKRSVDEAALYSAPFEYLERHVKPERVGNARKTRAENWWLLGETIPKFRRAVRRVTRYVSTARVTKHRIFVWVDSIVLPDCQVFAFARSDDYFFGLLHSRIHEVWSRSQGTQVRERESGFRYTHTTCFETFPFPIPSDDHSDAIGNLAQSLDALRSRWLNPPEWTREEVLEFPGSVDGPWSRFVHGPDERGIGTVRYPVLKPRSGPIGKELADRTLTNLYNARPAWLDAAHRKLDAAVFAAYGWQPGMTDDEILAALLALNLQRTAAGAPIAAAADADGPSE